MEANNLKPFVEKSVALTENEGRNIDKKAAMVGNRWCSRFLVRHHNKWLRISEYASHSRYTHIEWTSDPTSLSGMKRFNNSDHY